MICRCTNEEAQRRGDKQFTVSLADLESYIKLQYAREIYGKGHLVAFLWSKRCGISIFYESMSRDYFSKILKYQRFDDKSNRVKSGRGAENFATIGQIFVHFANHCQKKYTYKLLLTVDEQLMLLKSRCSFVTFMSNKPDKNGVKFLILTDVEAKYVSNTDDYLGAQEKKQRGGAPLAESMAVTLCKHIKGKGYDIACDNFFIFLPAAKKLARNKPSIVGTGRKNQRKLCKKMTEPENKVTYSNNFYWHDPTICEISSKREKVSLLAFQHAMLGRSSCE